jgi:hypothetical protein
MQRAALHQLSQRSAADVQRRHGHDGELLGGWVIEFAVELLVVDLFGEHRDFPLH